MFLDNENYKLLLIIPCRIENMAQNIYTAITFKKTKIFFFKFRIVAGCLPYKLHMQILNDRRQTVSCLMIDISRT